MMNFKTGFLYTALSTVFVAIQFLFFIKGSTILTSMDLGGWSFFIASCISHAAMFALIPFIFVYVPLALLRLWKIGGSLMVGLMSILSVLIFLDMQVYDIYRFHINGFILNMVFSSGATEIFAFDTILYIKEIGLFLVFVICHIVLWILACRWTQMFSKKLVWVTFCLMIGTTLYAHCFHIYASFRQQPSVMKCRRLLPYYFPTTAYSLMTKMGFEAPVDNGTDKLGVVEGDVWNDPFALGKMTDERVAYTSAFVPEEVEVISLIGTKYANITRPTLSSFDIDMQDVGKRSMYMLMDLMKGELAKKTYRIESVYRKRGSTKE